MVQGNVVANREVLAGLENSDKEVWLACRTAIADLIADGKLNPKCFGCVIGIFGEGLVKTVLGRFGWYSLGKANEKHVLNFLEIFKKFNGGLVCLHEYALDFVANKNILDFLKINCGKLDPYKELNRFIAYLTYSGRDDAERLNAFCEYINTVSVCDERLVKAIICDLDLRNISVKNLTRLIDRLESLQFDAVKYLNHLRVLRNVLNGRPVDIFGEESKDDIYGYFARIFAYLTVRGNVTVQAVEALYGIYGNTYAECYAEELICSANGKIKSAKAHEILCGKCASIERKTNSFLRYAKGNEPFRLKTERIYTGN